MSSTEENGDASALRAPGNPASGPSDVQHTKGPWRAIRGGVLAGSRIYQSQSALSAMPEADAHLIAAAPNMLKALKGVLRIADRKTAEFDAARAAIALATKSEVQS